MTNMSPRPNILLITSDQQHSSTLGCLNPRIRTPNLDRLAAEGTRFARGYCNNPLCSPSHATIITGMYPAWHHCWTLGTKLPEDVPTVGERLRASGYDTALVGKAHFQPAGTAPDQESLEYMPKLRDLAFWRQSLDRGTAPTASKWRGCMRTNTLPAHTTPFGWKTRVS